MLGKQVAHGLIGAWEALLADQQHGQGLIGLEDLLGRYGLPTPGLKQGTRRAPVHVTCPCMHHQPMHTSFPHAHIIPSCTHHSPCTHDSPMHTTFPMHTSSPMHTSFPHACIICPCIICPCIICSCMHHVPLHTGLLSALPYTGLYACNAHQVLLEQDTALCRHLRSCKMRICTNAWGAVQSCRT